MDNIEFLKAAGFFEKDGWLCNPKLNGEAIFKLGDATYGVENKSMDWILSVISATAFNAGTCWSRVEERKNLIAQLEDMIKELKDS